MISAQNVGHRFGPQILFEGASFLLTFGARVGLVGPNGAGKTTLLKILAGEAAPDSGEVVRARGVTVGMLAQEIEPMRGGTVLELAMRGAKDLHAIETEMKELLPYLETDNEIATRYAHLVDEFGRRGGYSLESEARAILHGVGFSEREVERPVSEYSGGWQMRVELARLLLAEPDVLLLDEPTNHLDLESIVWLESFLRAYKGAVIIISHDRTFLNRLVTSIFEIALKRFTEYVGNYDDYIEAKEARAAQLEAEKAAQDREIARLERFVERFRAKATKARQAQSRLKMLEKIERIELQGEEKRVQFRIAATTRSGREVLSVRGLKKAFGEKVVFAGVGALIVRGERIALVGPNGAGKSTFLKLVAGAVSLDAGECVLGHNVSVHYFAQHQIAALDPKKTVLEEAFSVSKGKTLTQVRSTLGAFLFSGDAVDKPVAVLSGGEKNRLALAKMLLNPANLLLLDEPESHLDIPSREMLVESLQDFDGTIVFVSHDRTIMNQLATRVLEVTPKMLDSFPGNFDEYQEKKCNHRGTETQSAETQRKKAGFRKGETEAEAGTSAGAEAGAGGRKSRDDKRREAEERARVARATRGLREKIDAAEEAVAEIEARIAAIDGELADPALYADGARVAMLATERAEKKAALDEMYAEWEKATTEMAYVMRTLGVDQGE
jgi:ATP-binding cassette subfamily F protein 3